MDRKKTFDPGDPVITFTGQVGIVTSQEAFARMKNHLREGKRPGYFFSPGCCQHPDYLTQVPVLFEDGTYDVMRAMYIKRAPDLPAERKALILDILDDQLE